MTINRLNQGTTNQVLVKAISGQTTNLLELQDSSGNVVSSIGPTGALGGTISNSGLVHIETQTATGVGAINFNDVFTSAYNNYKIVGRVQGSTDMEINFRLREAGNDIATSVYLKGLIQVGAGASQTLFGTNNTADTKFAVTNVGSANAGGFVLDLIAPKLAVRKVGLGIGSGRVAQYSGVQIQSTATADGFSIIAGTGTLVDTQVSVYGYKL